MRCAVSEHSETYFEVYQSRSADGLRMEWRWRLKHHNGNIIADSGEGYFNKNDCEHGIELVRGSESSPVRQQSQAARISEIINDEILKK